MRFVRYSILSFIGLAAIATGAFAQTFDLQNPFPATQPLFGVSSSGSTVYAVGDRGTFLKSPDGGTNWSRILSSNFQPADRYNSVVAMSSSNALLFGTGSGNTPKVFKTTDGGTSVTSSSSGISGNTRLNSATFVTSTNGWVVGKDVTLGRGTLYNTQNGGSSWTSMTSGVNLIATNFSFMGVNFYDANTGLVVGTDSTLGTPAGVVYATSNGGTSWGVRGSANFPVGATFRSVAYLSSTTAFLVGKDITNNVALLFTTLDGGLTWTRVRTNDLVAPTADISNCLLYDIRFLAGSTTTGWAVGDSTDGSGKKWQVILTTTDAGLSWQRQDNSVQPGTLYSVRPASILAAWAVGYTQNNTSLTMTYIGSGIWFQQSKSLGLGPISSLSFISRTVGFAVGTPSNASVLPQLARTQNAGFSWTTLPYTGAGLVAGSSITGVQFFNSTTGWVAGQNNTKAVLYKTNDGGNNWTVPTIVFANNTKFNALKWQDVVIGYVAGQTTSGTPSPVLYFTSDAGVNWAATGGAAISGNGGINTLSARPGVAYLGGFKQVGATISPLLARSLDYGVSWTALTITTGASGIVKGSFIQSLDSVWVCGSDANGGFIQMTVNGSVGTPTWTSPSTNIVSAFGAASVNSVYFVTQRIGFAVGVRTDGNALVLSTIDGGVTWSQMDPKHPVGLNSAFVAFTNQADVWMAGDNESVLHTILNVPLVTNFPSQMFLGANRTTSDTAIAWFSIGNVGTSDLVINLTPNWSSLADGSVPNDYILDPKLSPSLGTRVIKPGVIDSFKVIFRPTAYAPRTGTLSFTTNSARGDNVTMRFNGTGAFSSASYAYTSLGSPITNSMHNDTVNVGNFLDDTLFVRNYFGTARLNVKSIALSGTSVADYSIVKGITSPVPVGGEDSIIVRFSPLQGFSRPARMLVTTDAAANTSSLFLLNGFGGCVEDRFDALDTLFLTTHVIAQGKTNNYEYDTVVVCNTCSLPVAISSQQIAGLDAIDYTIVDSLDETTPIASGACDTAIIKFQPFFGDSMPKSAQYVIHTNARITGNLVKQLSGYACSMTQTTTDTIQGVALLFDSGIPATQLHASLIINTGVCDLMLDSVKLFNQDTLNLYSVTYLPTPHVMAPGDTDSVQVTFTARELGVHEAQVVVWSNATNSPTQTISYSDTVNAPDTVGVRENGIVVTNYALQQNYPNPFNPTTLIRYALPTRAMVTLTVTNALGQVVEVLANEMHEAGQYHVNFNATNLPSGTYTYQLRAGSTVLSRTMTLLK